MRNIFRLNLSSSPRSSQRGSALLIVLGFLSFMIISAVSFAIYMRIERQASSNYRHSVAARHLLNSALFRAIDDIDAELRLQDTGYFKFPESNGDNWPGRVKASAVEDSVDNAQDAHVLSLEALSFLPAFLINDVRRYAVRDAASDSAWMGAKWRPMDRSMDGDVVGRYAYVCVNLSDMLDVNQCKALARDSYTNRVSLGHLFADKTEREDFDEAVSKDIRYFSLQDFYSARYERYKTVDSSPYHTYLNSTPANLTVFGAAGNQDHVFCTDSIVKPEPTNSVACNIVLNQPIDPTLLAQEHLNTLPFNGSFLAAVNAMRNDKDSPSVSTDWPNYIQIMPFLIADYIDHDNTPKWLNVPSVEMVPMISEIRVDQAICSPKIRTQSAKVGDPAHDVTMYYLQLMGIIEPSTDLDKNPPELSMPLYVEVVWPFKYHQSRTVKPSFTVEVDAYLQIHFAHSNKKTTDFMSLSECIPLKCTPGNVPNFWNKTIKTEADCYESVPVTLSLEGKKGILRLIDSDKTKYNSFNGDFSVSLIVFPKVKCGTTVVDCAPQVLPYPGASGDVASELSVTPKLFFQTIQRSVQAPMNMQPMTYEWSGLEVADPRFNYKASNWVKNDGAPANDKGINPSTTALLGKEGRDADIFMAVSDTRVLQSPGELGYIIRPFPYSPIANVAWDFRASYATAPEDKEAMFRTFRLYDQGAATGAQYDQDLVYKYFYTEESDGTLKGARVNPLSDLPEVLEAAIWDTPLDYWFASTNCPLSADIKAMATFNQSVLHFNNDAGKWEDFRDVWADALDAVTPEVNKAWNRSISDYYGDWQYFKWYSDDISRKSIFNGFTLDNPLHEIDRKMLYSFSLESFSDRQQLFLFILRAEATSPSFGSSADSGMRSLAGGRAVALVWRDPYPRGYKKSANTWEKRTGVKGWYPDNDFDSPWKQYAYMGNSKQRRYSYHDTRILFFKQLDQ